MGLLGIFGGKGENPALSALSPLLEHLDDNIKESFVDSELLKGKLLKGRISLNDYKAACIGILKLCTPHKGDDAENAAKAVLAFYVYTNYNIIASDAFFEYISKVEQSKRDLTLLRGLHIPSEIADPWRATWRHIEVKYGLTEEEFSDIVAFLFQTLNLTKGGADSVRVPKSAFIISFLPYAQLLAPLGFKSFRGKLKDNLIGIFRGKKADNLALKQELKSANDVAVLIAHSEKERDRMVKRFRDEKVSRYGIIVLNKTGLELTSPLLSGGMDYHFKKQLNEARKQVFAYFAPVFKDLSPEERAGFVAVLESIAVRESLGHVVTPFKVGFVVPLSITFATFLPVSWALFASGAVVMLASCVLVTGTYWSYVYKKRLGNIRFLIRMHEFMQKKK